MTIHQTERLCSSAIDELLLLLKLWSLNWTFPTATRLPLFPQIFLPRPGVAGDINKTVELKEGTKAVSAINVSDPDATIFFSAKPSIDVQLVLMLAYSSPPNSSYSSNTTVLGQEGTKLRLCIITSHCKAVPDVLVPIGTSRKWLCGHIWLVLPRVSVQTSKLVSTLESTLVSTLIRTLISILISTPICTLISTLVNTLIKT